MKGRKSKQTHIYDAVVDVTQTHPPCRRLHIRFLLSVLLSLFNKSLRLLKALIKSRNSFQLYLCIYIHNFPTVYFEIQHNQTQVHVAQLKLPLYQSFLPK